MIGSVALLALLLQAAPAKATIEGTVLRAGSSDAVAGVRVTLTKPVEPRTPQTAAADRLRPPAGIPSAVTDAQGKFVLKDVDAGAYRLAFAASGFVRQEYGQKLYPGQGTLMELSAGQAMKGLFIHLSPTATVSGRVWDSNRQPVAAVPVHLMRFTYDANGRRTLQPISSTQTDDRGEYRAYYLTPGRYYLAAGMLREARPAQPVNGAMDSYAVTYYPGVADIGAATPIDIKPGAELNMDVLMTPQTFYRIRGKVVDARMPQPPTSVIVGLTSIGASGNNSYEVDQRLLTYSSADGRFEIREVLPGSYLLTVTWGDSVQVSNAALASLGLSPPTPGASGGTSAFNVLREGIAYLRISVANSDIENVALTLMPGGVLPGRLRVDSPNAAAASIQNMKVQLKPSLGGLPANIPGVYQSRPGDVASDGTFSMANVKIGEYRVSVDGMPPGYYLKEARYGASDVLNRPLQFSPDGSNNPLEVVVAAGASTVTGSASNERNETAAGAQIVLVPEKLKDRLDLYKTVMADARGQFSITNIAPGDYKVFAWEALESNAFFDPDLLQQMDARGKSVHLTDTSTQTVDIKAIAAASSF